MLTRFSLYDFISVVIPGIFFLWAVATVTDAPFLRGMMRLSGGVTETSVLIVVGYVTGLILHGISGRVTQRFLLRRWGGFPSARWLLPADQTFSQTYKTGFVSTVKEKFGVDLTQGAGSESERESLKRNQEVFFRCYRAVEKLSELPQTFVAEYGLYRSLLTVFVLLTVISAWNYVTKYHWGLRSDGAFFLTASIVGMVVSSWQVKKRGEDFAKSVYDVFLANFPSKGVGETRRP